MQTLTDQRTKQMTQIIQQVVLGKQDSYTWIQEFRTHIHIVHKDKLKMACRLKYRDFPGSLVCGNLQCSAGDMDSIPGQGIKTL